MYMHVYAVDVLIATYTVYALLMYVYVFVRFGDYIYKL